MSTTQLPDLTDIDPNDLGRLPDEQFAALAAQLVEIAQEDRKVNALEYYRPVSDKARSFHWCEAHTLGIGGGNGSSKTETALVDILMCATGVLPPNLWRVEGDEEQSRVNKERLAALKFRGPVDCRIVVESLTTTLFNVILPKLMWFKWTGVDAPGGERGHWGWIPRDHLIDFSWEKSWSSKTRTLRVYCKDPLKDEIVGESTIQFMSHDQDATDFASGDFHHVLHDEPTTYAIWRENQARTMRVNGRCILAMTWPDDPQISVDWIFDEVYDRGVPGPNKHDDVEFFEFYSVDNPNLDQEAVARQMAKWDAVTRAVRIYGKPIRFGNLIHPLFTDTWRWWSFEAGETVEPVDGKCPVTGSDNLCQFIHVRHFDWNDRWPVIFLLDPHPRKPHMAMWVGVDPNDDYFQIAELLAAQDTEVFAQTVFSLEQERGFRIAQRLGDPNMLQTPSGSRRGVTWRDEFDDVGLLIDLADDVSVGRTRVNEYLRPDPGTHAPRITIHPGCETTIQQFKRYSWEDWRRGDDNKDLKQKPRDKYDDFPTLWKYLMNARPEFSALTQGRRIIARPGTRRGGY